MADAGNGLAPKEMADTALLTRIGRTISSMQRIEFRFELHNGNIPQDSEYSHGACVLHHCDNPACVNPDHLFLGTMADNMNDMIAKGRKRCATRINTEAVLAIRSSSLPVKDLAHMFGISPSHVYRILARQIRQNV